MSAYFDTGFCVRTPSWHGQERLEQRAPANWDEAREWAGLTWEPKVLPVYAFQGDLDAAKLRIMAAAEGMSEESEVDALRALADSVQQIPGQQRIVRDDTQATLGITSTNYQTIGHGEMGEVMDALLEQDNVVYETAGSVRGGQQVWALAYLDEPVHIGGEASATLPYVGLTTRHDGTGALRAQATSVRIVCANTFTAAEAESDRNGTAYTFQHSSKWRDRIEEARETIKGVRREFAVYCELMEELSAIHVSPEQTEQFIGAFIPAPPAGLTSKRVQTNIEGARDKMRIILASPTSDGVRETAYGWVQAAGEYLDHYRATRSLDGTLTRQLLKPQPLKGKAVQLAREVAAV
jgi:phage/plasmid-like protein (TIGR03299 family)